jgi:hypothetical protein
LRAGLEVAIKDGSFEKLFQTHNRAAIVSADIRNRTVIEMNNPLFHHERTEAYRPELWFQP